jgi:hypothetical protein
MNATEFIKYFNVIKPNLEEIKKSISSISADIAFEISKDFDLKITSLILNEDPIIDLIENTNICDTRFSVFNFYDIATNDSIVKIGMIDEKGIILFDKSNGLITFEELYDDMYDLDRHSINQTEFLEVYLNI